jgi:hypothetical protein
LQPALTLLLNVAAYGAPLHLEHVAGLVAVVGRECGDDVRHRRGATEQGLVPWHQ